jgi:hypothetical protein
MMMIVDRWSSLAIIAGQLFKLLVSIAGLHSAQRRC